MIFIAFFVKHTQRECNTRKVFYESFIKVREIKKTCTFLWNCDFDQSMIISILLEFILTFSQLMMNLRKFILITLNFDFLMFTYNLYCKKRSSTTRTCCTCFFKILKRNENIINICKNKYVEIFSKCDVNIRLKSC